MQDLMPWWGYLITGITIGSLTLTFFLALFSGGDGKPEGSSEEEAAAEGDEPGLWNPSR